MSASDAMSICDVLLVTANVGSIFEDPEVLLRIWIQEFLSTVARVGPHFVAIHCQEVGGKHFERSMRNVDNFVRTLLSSKELSEFSRVRIFLDEDFLDVEKFTALGNFYLIHDSQKEVYIWDFKDELFIAVNGKDIYSGNIENVSVKQKIKFPQNFFPESKWSRKGFMRTRWQLYGQSLDLTNIHLFHDADNFVANDNFPSVYANSRLSAFEYTLRTIQIDDDSRPHFVFGDFNFRLDTRAVIHKLTDACDQSEVKSARSGQTERIEWKSDDNDDDRPVLSLGKKAFDFRHKEWFRDNRQSLLLFDLELKSFKERLFEIEITFPPSYPFREDISIPADLYMNTRCPAWCDRILANRKAETLLHLNTNSEHNLPIYAMMGSSVPMGDHKPIYLVFRLQDSSSSCSSVPVRTRTNSYPIHPKHEQKAVARRVQSLFAHPIHSQDWRERTRHLLDSTKARVRVRSSRSVRLSSHHSSSDEEWYSDFRCDTSHVTSQPEDKHCSLCHLL